MISTQELIILFIAVVVAAALAVTALTAQIQVGIGTTKAAATAASKRVAADMDIISVHSAGGDTNVYIKGVSGEINVETLSVIVNGVPVTPVYSGFVRDGGTAGILDPGDLYIVEIPGTYTEQDCITVDTAQATALWGLCS